MEGVSRPTDTIAFLRVATVSTCLIYAAPCHEERYTLSVRTTSKTCPALFSPVPAVFFACKKEQDIFQFQHDSWWDPFHSQATLSDHCLVVDSVVGDSSNEGTREGGPNPTNLFHGEKITVTPGEKSECCILTVRGVANVVQRGGILLAGKERKSCSSFFR
jgi:hypothetical protein